MISVLIPTYKRLPFLKRAVEDVFSQTYSDWELIISDDEVGESETWLWLKELAAKESKVRIVKNDGPKHGQVYNVNNGLRECRGEWVKPFFDDDRMRPDCLEKMIRVVDRLDQIKQPSNQTIKQFSIAMIGCRAEQWRDGVHVGDEKNYASHPVEVIRQENCRCAMFMFDRWNGRTPQHMLIRRSAIEAGALMPEDGKYHVPVDCIWFSRILDYGDYAMMSDVLVEQHEGETTSVTSGARADEFALDQEFFGAYSDIWQETDVKARKGIRVEDVTAQINGVRGLYHFRCGRRGAGLKMVMKMFGTWRGPLLTLRWLLQETFPGHFCATRREVVRG